MSGKTSLLVLAVLLIFVGVAPASGQNRDDVLTDLATSDSIGSEKLVILGERISPPFSAKKVSILIEGHSDTALVREVSKFSFTDFGNRIEAMIPVQFLTVLQEHGIAYDEIRPEEASNPNLEHINTGLDEGSTVLSPKGCWESPMRYGNDADYYQGDYDIPGDAGGNGVTLSPGSFSGGIVEWDECLSWYTSCANTITSMEVHVLSQEVCFLGGCVDPWVFLYNWSTNEYDYNWHVPKDFAWHYITPSNPNNYASSTNKCIYWGISVAPANKTYVWQSYLYVCFTDNPPVCEVSPTSINFGSVRLHTTESEPFDIANTGCQVLSGSFSVSGTGFSVSSETYSVPAGESRRYYAYFEPSVCGTVTGSITMGSGCTPISLSGTGYDNADCRLPKTSHNFGSVKVGNNEPWDFQICNDADCATLSGTMDAVGSGFAVEQSSYNVPPGQCRTYTVWFEPNDCGSFSGRIEFSSGCGDITLSGTGWDDPDCDVSRTDIPFPDTDVGSESNPICFTISNTGCGTLGGSVSVNSNHFRVTAPDGLSYSLGEGNSKQFCVYFKPESGGNLDATIETGSSYCQDVYVHGRGIEKGCIEGTIATTSGSPVQGVQVCISGNGFSDCSTTGSDGSYKVEDIPLTSSPYTVTPTLSGHEFDPPTGSGRYCYVTVPSPCCVKDFTDITTYVVAGHVTYTTCNNAAVAGVEMWVNGELLPDVTNQSGYYETTVQGGQNVTVEASLSGHIFLAPNPRTFYLDDDRYDIDFRDDTKAEVSGICRTGCDDPLSGVTVTLQGLDFTCLIEDGPTLADGRYSVEVPPGNYNICATSNTMQFLCEDIEVPSQGLAHDFIPQTHLVLSMDPGPPIHPSCPDVNYIESGDVYEVTVFIRDAMGCPVYGASIEIIDEVEFTEGTGSPETKYIYLGETEDSFVYPITGGRPGSDKSLQISVEKSGYLNNDNENISITVSVGGHLWLGDTFTLTLPDGTPMLVLYDPPGDGSYSEYQSSVTFYAGFGLHLGLEIGGSIEAHAGGALVGGTIGGELSITTSITGSYDYLWEMTSAETYRTSNEQNSNLIGPPGGTHFLCAGLKLRYGEASHYYWNENLCLLEDSVVISYELEQDQSEVIPSFLSAYAIENNIIPPLPESEQAVWQQLLNYDVSRDCQIDPAEYEYLKLDQGDPINEDKAWSGGGSEYEYVKSITQGHRITVEAELVVEASLAYKYGLDILGLVEGGVKAVIRTKMTIGGYVEGGLETTNTTRYLLTDDDQDDLFHTIVYEDATFGTPVFLNGAGTVTMCPWEACTDSNEAVDLINLSGIWDTTVCPDPIESVDIQYELRYAGLLDGGSEYRIYAVTNSCGASVTFNGMDEIVVPPGSDPFVITVSITPNSLCTENTIVFRAESTCDGQIYSEETLTIDFDPNNCPEGVYIEFPEESDSPVSGLLDVIASYYTNTIDGIRFYHKQEGGGQFLDCFSETSSSSETPFRYNCSLDTETLEDGMYWLLAFPVISGIDDLEKGDSVLIEVDNTCPSVIRAVPQEGAPYVDAVRIEFSELMDNVTINCNTFTVFDLDGQVYVPCDLIAYTDRTYEFVPLNPINPDNEYRGECSFEAADLAGNPLCEEFTWIFNTEIPQCPFETYAITNLSAAFNAQICVEDLVADIYDCIGAFDPDGKCVGVTEPILENNASYMSLVIYGDDPTTPSVDEGMNEGECFTLRLFDASEDRVLYNPEQYCHWVNMNGAPLPGDIPYICFDPVTCSDIALCEGWNLISFTSIPEHIEIDSVFKDCIPDITYVTSFDNGSVFFDPNGPGFLNTLTDISPDFGYWVKVSVPCTLSTCGTMTLEGHSVYLDAGWNLIAYWPSQPCSPAEAFEPLITSDNLIYTTGFGCGGPSVYYDPNGPDFLNTLLELDRPEGYWLKIHNAVTGFTYPLASPLAIGPGGQARPSAKVTASLPANGLAVYPWEYNPTNLSGAFISRVSIKGNWAEGGDVIAAFDTEGNCAGAATVTINSGESYANLQIYGDDELTLGIDEGINLNEPFTLRLYDISTKTVYYCQDTFFCWSNTYGAPLTGPCNDIETVYDFANSIKDSWAFIPTLSSGCLLGKVTIKGEFADSIDLIAAFDTSSNCAGFSHVILDNGIAYINLPIYGDDPATPEINEGMQDGEPFTIRVYDASENIVYFNELDTFYCWSNTNGAPLDPPCNDYNLIYDVMTDACEIRDVPLPASYSLSANYPNPFNPTTIIEFSLPEKTHVNISVYNILGQHITTLIDDFKSAGSHSIVWNGRGNSGHPIATGVYLYRMQAGNYIETKKMVLLK